MPRYIDADALKDDIAVLFERNEKLIDEWLANCVDDVIDGQPSKAQVDFNQGLDIRLVNDRNLELIKQIKLANIHFAFDRWKDKDIIEPRLRAFKEKTGFNRGKGNVMVYILCNFDTTIEQDIYRIQLCRELNFSPYPMIYDKEHCDPIYRKLQRWCNNAIFWKVKTFEEYKNGKEIRKEEGCTHHGTF